jgi:Na+-translocating ferredoxin:NAD+ oxidoreductase RnfC subunit
MEISHADVITTHDPHVAATLLNLLSPTVTCRKCIAVCLSAFGTWSLFDYVLMLAADRHELTNVCFCCKCNICIVLLPGKR